MLSFDYNIDLDALFDSLNIAGGAPSRAPDAISSDVVSSSKSGAADFQELTVLHGELFLFDTPADQS